MKVSIELRDFLRKATMRELCNFAYDNTDINTDEIVDEISKICPNNVIISEKETEINQEDGSEIQYTELVYNDKYYHEYLNPYKTKENNKLIKNANFILNLIPKYKRFKDKQVKE